MTVCSCRAHYLTRLRELELELTAASARLDSLQAMAMGEEARNEIDAAEHEVATLTSAIRDWKREDVAQAADYALRYVLTEHEARVQRAATRILRKFMTRRLEIVSELSSPACSRRSWRISFVPPSGNGSRPCRTRSDSASPSPSCTRSEHLGLHLTWARRSANDIECSCYRSKSTRKKSNREPRTSCLCVPLETLIERDLNKSALGTTSFDYISANSSSSSSHILRTAPPYQSSPTELASLASLGSHRLTANSSQSHLLQNRVELGLARRVVNVRVVEDRGVSSCRLCERCGSDGQRGVL